LARELEAIVDPETGVHPVARVYRRDAMYVGEATPGMPELLVGYTPGYRSSSPSVLGGAGRATIGLNHWAWSGDHSMARDLVPGTLVASRRLAAARPNILDLPVTLLDWFGLGRPPQMVGRSLLG
jgi:hypothetical protein